MEAPDGTGVGDQAPVALPTLVTMDVAQHESLRQRGEESVRGELVVEARHRNAVLGDADAHGAV